VELLHGVTYSLFNAASVVHADHITPEGTKTTMQGIVSGITGLCTTIGALSGGLVSDELGVASMFHFFALGAISLSITAGGADWCLRRVQLHDHEALKAEAAVHV